MFAKSFLSVATLFFTGGLCALAAQTPALQFDVGLTGTTSSTQMGPAHRANGGFMSDGATRWNVVGAAQENQTGAAMNVAPGSLVSATGELLPAVGVVVGQSASTTTPWVPNYAETPDLVIRNPGQVGVYANNVMKDMLCFNNNGRNLASFLRITGLAEGRYGVYSMHRNGFQGLPSLQTVAATAGTATTDLTAATKTELVFAAAADTATWVFGKNYAFNIVEVTADAPDIIVAAYSGQNNQKGCINAVQIVPLEMDAGIIVTDTTLYAGQEWRTPCVVRFEATGELGTSPLLTWNYGIDPAQALVGGMTVTNRYENPGTYIIRLQVVDAETGKTGLANQTLVLTGNAGPVANAGPMQSGYVGDSFTLDASGSTDPNTDDTLSYAWTQLSGVPATLDDATAPQPTYSCTVPSTNVFQVVVSDNGDPVRTSSAVVTNYVYAKFTAAAMIDFGPRDPSSANISQKTNTPAHVHGALTTDDTFWIGYGVGRGDNATLPDFLNGALDSRGQPIGLKIDLGRNGSLIPNYGNQPFHRTGGDNSGKALFNNNMAKDFMQADNGSNVSFVRLSGFAEGRYGVYITARNTFNGGNAEYQYLRAGTGTATTQLVTSWDAAKDKIGFSGTAERDATVWTEGINFRFVTVEVTADNPDILVVSQYASGASDVKSGVINTIQVVPVVLNADFISTADAGGRAPQTVAFDASTSTGSGLTYTWRWGDGSHDETFSTATASHHYELPGTYSVQLTITDENKQIGVLVRTITLTGNHIPIADAGAEQSEYLAAGVPMFLDASASTDADAGDTLSMTWEQILGPAVSIADATMPQASYQPTVPGTYVFRVTATDNGEPARSSSAVVTNRLFSYFKAAVNLDFGAWGSPSPGDSLATNAPAFVAGTLKPSFSTWFVPSDADDSAGRVYPVADLITGAIAADGADVGLLIDYGRSFGTSWAPDWNSKPAQRAAYVSNDRGQRGVYNNMLGTDFLYGGDRLHLRLRGFEPGKYDVYVASRNIFAETLQQAVRIGVGDADTVLDGDWQDDEKLAAYTMADVAALSTDWVEGQTYITRTVRVTADAPDILVIGGFISGNDNKGGVINLLQVVPHRNPCTLIVLR